MQSLMQKMTATAILFAFFLASAHADDPAAAVPSPFSLRPNPTTTQFVKAYAAYAIAVKDHGVEGLKAFAAPDFVIYSQGRPLRGEDAFKEIGKIGLLENCFSAAVHPLSVTGTDAAALSEETYMSPAKSHNQDASWSFTYDWKQTWRKTPQGWKLARIERYPGDFAHLEGVTYTVLRDSKSEPAKAQEKQNMVK